MGPSVKFVSSNKGLISKKQKGGSIFLSGKMTKPGGRGGGAGGGLAKNHTFSQYVFWDLPLFYSATFVETTPAAQTNVKFYAMAHFLWKTTSFYKKTTPLL